MIHNPFLLILILLAVEFGVLFLAGNPRTKHLFSFLPSMFWIYFLPMVLSTCGIIDAKSPLYAGITKYLLPPALFLLLLNVDIKAISRLGPAALVMFFAGSFGIMLGMVISFIIFKPLVGAQFWAGFGALSASWTGGSANMIAVKEALNTPDAVFMPMVIVDTIVPYTWMGILVALAVHQKSFDSWNRSDRRILDDLARRTEHFSKQKKQSVHPGKAILIIGLGFTYRQWHAQVIIRLFTNRQGRAFALCLDHYFGLDHSHYSVHNANKPHPAHRGQQIRQMDLIFCANKHRCPRQFNNTAQAGILIVAGVLVIFIHVVILLDDCPIDPRPIIFSRHCFFIQYRRIGFRAGGSGSLPAGPCFRRTAFGHFGP